MTRAVQRRRPAGTPAGGQFAESARAETNVTLADPSDRLAAFPADADPGQTPAVSVGSRTPWGTADVATAAPGAVFVSTPGHGGIKLSPERNAHIPPSLRQSSGWYDEDDGAQIVSVFHPDLWSGHEATVRESGLAYLRNFQPEKYESLTGVSLGPEESWIRALAAEVDSRESLRQRWSSDFVTTGSVTLPFLPGGHGAVAVECRDTGESRILLCDKDFWSSRGISDTREPVRIDGNMIDITDLVNQYNAETTPPPPPPVSDLGVDTTGLTDTQRAKATQQLSTRYRYPDGVVRTLAEGLIHQGAYGKQVANSQGRAAYWIRLPDSRVQTVAKATFDALTGVPDISDGDVHLSLELSAARRAAGIRPDDTKVLARLRRAVAAMDDVEQKRATRSADRHRRFHEKVLARLAEQ